MSEVVKTIFHYAKSRDSGFDKHRLTGTWQDLLNLCDLLDKDDKLFKDLKIRTFIWYVKRYSKTELGPLGAILYPKTPPIWDGVWQELRPKA